MSPSPTPFKHVTLGVDFSENSRTTLQWLHQHFAPDAVIDLVHTVELPRIPGFVRDAFPRYEEWVENLRRGAATRLAEAAAGCGSVGESIVVEGRPYDGIIGRAKESGADLVAVGAQGEHRGLGKLVGSTPGRLLESSPVPVLVVRGAADHRPARILVTVDDSAMTDKVLAAAWRAAATTSAEVILLTITPTWLVESMRRHGGGDQVGGLLEQQMEQAGKWLADVVKRSGLEPSDQLVESGSPDLEILRAARRVNADLIIMGTRGGSRSAPPLVGGCARFVLHNATCPVLFVVG